MPPKSNLTGSFSVAEAGNEVVCPLKNNDGSTCRKRCFGEKRYRSMQEHIRRAHPDYYISKLPATEESFLMMVNTPLEERPQQQTPENFGSSSAHTLPYSVDMDKRRSYLNQGFMHDPSGFYGPQSTSPHQVHHHDVRRPSFVPTANAAAALAQLHNSRPESDWDVEREHFPDQNHDAQFPNYFVNSDPPNMFTDHHSSMHDSHRGDGNNLLPSHFPTSGSRASSIQPFQRPRPNRPRKSSITESARKAKHERQRSKDQKRLSHDRKAISAEPGGLAATKRWEDLLDAAASATEEDSRDLTPIPQSPRGSVPPYQGQNHNQFQSYNTSPLQQSVLPHSPDHTSTFETPSLEAFPTVESYDNSGGPHNYPQHHHNSSADSSSSNPFTYPRMNHNHHHSQHHHQPSSSGSNFHMPPSGLSSSPADMTHSASASALTHAHMHSHSYSQPTFPTTHQTHESLGGGGGGGGGPGGGTGVGVGGGGGSGISQPQGEVKHYCAACHRIVSLNTSFACTECICGICGECRDVLVNMGADRGARCPRCGVLGGRFKPFMLELR